MSVELPIVCSLSAPDLSARLAEIAELGRDALVQSHITGTRAELRFAGSEEVRVRIDAIVAAESQCCTFLSMHIAEQGDVIVLTIDAPKGAGMVVQQLVDAFCAQHGRAAPTSAS